MNVEIKLQIFIVTDVKKKLLNVHPSKDGSTYNTVPLFIKYGICARDLNLNYKINNTIISSTSIFIDALIFFIIFDIVIRCTISYLKDN